MNDKHDTVLSKMEKKSFFKYRKSMGHINFITFPSHLQKFSSLLVIFSLCYADKYFNLKSRMASKFQCIELLFLNVWLGFLNKKIPL